MMKIRLNLQTMACRLDKNSQNLSQISSKSGKKGLKSSNFADFFVFTKSKIGKMFSKCFHRHFEHQKSRLFKRLFDILYTIRIRLYYFLNGLKFALFCNIYRYNSIKTGLFPIRLQKMFSKMFSRTLIFEDFKYQE